MATTLRQNKVEITVKSRRTNALLDTGASITVASASFINKTSLARTSFLPATHPVIKGVAGARLTVLGVLTVPISIGGVKFSHPVHIIQDLHYPFIRGLDFLNKNKHKTGLTLTLKCYYFLTRTMMSTTFTCYLHPREKPEHPRQCLFQNEVK